MYVNLHTLPRDHAMFTIFLAEENEFNGAYEEVDVVAPRRREFHKQVQAVMEAAQGELKDYDPELKVYGITNQSDGEVTFDGKWDNYRPLPMFPTEWTKDHETGAWGILVALMEDNLGGQHNDYLEWLMRP